MTKKSRWFLKLARPYVARRLRRQFADVRLLGGPELRERITREPVIFACNHVAWWDPLLLVHLDAALGSDGYCLMDTHNLDQLPFFRWVGAMPLDRRNSRHAYRDLRRAARVLDAPRKVLVIFPHGDQRPAHLSLEFKLGVATLALATRAPVIPLAIRYDYVEGPKPIVHLAAGSPSWFCDSRHTRESFVADLEARVAQKLKRIDDELCTPSQTFESLIRARPLPTDHQRIPLPATALRALSGGADND